MPRIIQQKFTYHKCKYKNCEKLINDKYKYCFKHNNINVDVIGPYKYVFKNKEFKLKVNKNAI